MGVPGVACCVLRRFEAEPSSSVFGVDGEAAAEAAAAAAAPRCMNFMVIRRDDMVLGVDCLAMVGSEVVACWGAMVGDLSY